MSHETGHVMRPNFFVNTPDILTRTCSTAARRRSRSAPRSPRPARRAGASTPASSCSSTSRSRPGSEEYLDSEKYQIRPRDWDAAPTPSGRTLAPYLAGLNEIRREHPALQQLRNLHFHYCDDDAVIVFSKRARATTACIVVVNLDPHGTREATIHLDLDALGVMPHSYFDDSQLGGESYSARRFVAHDLVSDTTWWWGADNYVRLDPHESVAHVIHVRQDDPT